jgi:8-oxo-dGTP pyrophosphatase MutT (NUDIX family)
MGRARSQREVGREQVGGARAEVVRAAGGVVLRHDDADGVEVAVVHRPLRQDWSLPKGKLDPGETLEACALREVEEETGLRCRLGRPAGATAYRDRRGRAKTVAYWLMEPVGGGFRPSDEVDEMRWLDPDDAIELLTYGRDRELLAAAVRLAASDAVASELTSLRLTS